MDVNSQKLILSPLIFSAFKEESQPSAQNSQVCQVNIKENDFKYVFFVLVVDKRVIAVERESK